MYSRVESNHNHFLDFVIKSTKVTDLFSSSIIIHSDFSLSPMQSSPNSNLLLQAMCELYGMNSWLDDYPFLRNHITQLPFLSLSCLCFDCTVVEYSGSWQDEHSLDDLGLVFYGENIFSYPYDIERAYDSLDSSLLRHIRPFVPAFNPVSTYPVNQDILEFIMT